MLNRQRRLIRADGTTVTFDKPQELVQIYEHLGFSELDLLNISKREKGPTLFMWVDDMGLMRTPLAPINVEASKLYADICQPQYRDQCIIRGNVYIFPGSDTGD